ncbi:uncharacterized protein LOC121877372 [Homarus americanus]|uniref:uncharacterized protein LOC121877372 n=1 Tax=Homarus americanus TaxID=6706 RepID=UPI001C491C8F|nr:uncharacterized protein LOC121877372 [Homarus americanus]
MELQRRVCVAVWVFTLAVLVICTPVPQEEGDGSSSGGLRQEQCPLGEEVEMLEGGSGRRVVVAPVVGGLGAAAARTSCHTHQAKPLFLNTQQDADILYKLLKDCIKTGKISSVWVPARRSAHYKKINRPLANSTVASYGNVEYDWMSAHYDRQTDNITLLPFPEKTHQRKGIICIRKEEEK